MSRFSLVSGSVIIVVWLVTMGFVLRNHYLRPAPIPAFSDESFFGSVEAIKKWRDIEEHMLIKQGESPIGASLTKISQQESPDKNMTYLADFRISVKLSPLLPQIHLKGKSLMDQRMQLERFHAAADIGPANLSATGAVANNTLYLKTNNNNKINLERMALRGPISLAEAVRPAIGSQLDIQPGNTLTTPVIDPLTGSNRGTLTIKIEDQEKITVGGETVRAFRVVSSLQDIETTMWVDAYGKTLKRNLVGNFTMEKTSATRALEVAPTLSEATEIPNLDIEEFKDVPLQQSTDSANQPQNTALGALRQLLQ